MNIYTSYTSFSQWSQFKSHGKKKCQIHPSWQMFQGSWPNGNLGGGGGFNKPWPPGLGGKQTSPWRSESWIHGVGRAFMSFHSQSAFMSFHIFISFVLYHTTQSVSHFWIKQMVFRNSTQKKKHNHHRSTKRSTSFEKQCRTWVLELGGRGLWGWNLWRKTNQSFQETYGWQEAIGSQIESEGDE